MRRLNTPFWRLIADGGCLANITGTSFSEIRLGVEFLFFHCMFLRASRRGPVCTSYWQRAFTQKNQQKDAGLFKRVLVDLKTGSTDEDLRRNIHEFELKLKELRESESLRTASSVLAKGSEELARKREEVIFLANKIGIGVQYASQPLQELAKKVVSALPDVTDSEVAKQVGKTVDIIERAIADKADVFQYGGIRSKEARMTIEKNLLREKQLRTMGQVQENPDAGSSVVHIKKPEGSGYSQKLWAWVPFAGMLESLRARLDKSDNYFVYFGREFLAYVSDKVSGIFSESETALVIKKVRETDPLFSIEAFAKLLREYVIPEILDGLLNSDLPALRQWSSEAAFKVLEATIAPILTAGSKSCGKILDLRNVEVAVAKLIDDRPMIVVTCHSQQLHYVTDPSGSVTEGSPSSPETVTYIFAFTQSEEGSEPNPTGWVMSELAVRDRSSGW